MEQRWLHKEEKVRIEKVIWRRDGYIRKKQHKYLMQCKDHMLSSLIVLCMFSISTKLLFMNVVVEFSSYEA